MILPWIVIIVYRFLVPLTILRWPFWGSILAVFADNFDVIIADAMGVTDYTLYNPIDKIMDTYMYILMGMVAWKWTNLFARKLVLGLLAYRIAGVVIYEVLLIMFPATNFQWLLFVFPNLFVFVFFYVVFFQTFFKKEVLTNWRDAIIPVLVLLVLKLAQEYMLHVAKFPIYDTIKTYIFSPLGIPL